MGGSASASGDMYAIVPGHKVSGVSCAVLQFAEYNFTIPKSATLALLPAISNILLLDRS